MMKSARRSNLTCKVAILVPLRYPCSRNHLKIECGRSRPQLQLAPRNQCFQCTSLTVHQGSNILPSGQSFSLTSPWRSTASSSPSKPYSLSLSSRPPPRNPTSLAFPLPCPLPSPSPPSPSPPPGPSRRRLRRHPVEPQVAACVETPRMVVVTSGKGGIGKTTTTANIGLSLARFCFAVVADNGLRNLDLLLDVENCVNYTAVEVLNGDCRLDQALVRDYCLPSLELLCISNPRSKLRPKLPLGFGAKALTWVVDPLQSRPSSPPHFVLIDCPAGIDIGFITAIARTNEAVLVTNPDITTLCDADRATGLLECDGIRDIKSALIL